MGTHKADHRFSYYQRRMRPAGGRAIWPPSYNARSRMSHLGPYRCSRLGAVFRVHYGIVSPRIYRDRTDSTNQFRLSSDPIDHSSYSGTRGMGGLGTRLYVSRNRPGRGHLGHGGITALAGRGTIGRRKRLSMSEKCIAHLQSPIGQLEIVGSASGVSSVHFAETDNRATAIPHCLISCVAQLEEYFAGARREFSLQLDLEGTEFQKKVWEKLLSIPFGKTVSYLDLAIALGNRKAIRA